MVYQIVLLTLQNLQYFLPSFFLKPFFGEVCKIKFQEREQFIFFMNRSLTRQNKHFFLENQTIMVTKLFHVAGLFLYPLKTESERFSDIFRG